MAIVQLNLPYNASISEIYRCFMEQTIQNSQVEISSATLKDYHLKLIDDLYENNLVDRNNESDKILENFETAKVENERLGERNLTFRTKFSDSERYSEFYDKPNAESIKVIGKDPTAKFLTTSVEYFGYDYCAGVQGSQTALSEEAGTSSLTFDKMLDKGILTSTIEATSYVKHDIPEGGYCYAREALLSLHLYTPYDVDIDNDCLTFGFSKTSYSYGDDRTVNLTTLKLLPQSTVNASARANYEVIIEKGCRAAEHETIANSSYKVVLFDQVRNMTRSCGFSIDFANISIAYFKKKHDEINEEDADDEDPLWLRKLAQCLAECARCYAEQLLGKRYGNGRHKTLAEEVYEQPIFEKCLLSWDIDKNISKNVSKFYTTDEANKSLEEGIKRTALIKHDIILHPSKNKRGINNFCGFLFEAINNARVMVEAAEQGDAIAAEAGRSYKFIEGDGKKYINDAGKEVASPEFVDANFLIVKSGEEDLLQILEEECLKMLVMKFKIKWGEELKKLSNFQIVVPKGLNESGEFDDYIKLNDDTSVDAASHDQVTSFYGTYEVMIKDAAAISPNLKKAKEAVKEQEGKVKKLKVTIELKTKIGYTLEDLDEQKIKLNLEISKFKDDCEREKIVLKERIEKVETVNTEINQIIRMNGPIPIPGIPTQDDVNALIQKQKEEKNETLLEIDLLLEPITSTLRFIGEFFIGEIPPTRMNTPYKSYIPPVKKLNKLLLRSLNFHHKKNKRSQ